MRWQKQKSIFVVFEGGEGSGKTTQATLLFQKLKREGRQVKYNDEPGSTALGFKIRSLLVESDKELDPFTEFLLFEADRNLDFRLNIIPALEEGFDVVQDRNYGSTFAYQGYAKGLFKTHRKLMHSVDVAARRGVKPDIIFLLDGSPKKLLKRIKRTTSFEKEKIGFHDAVRKGFLSQARADKKRWVVLDAAKPQNILQRAIWDKVSELMKQFI